MLFFFLNALLLRYVILFTEYCHQNKNACGCSLHIYSPYEHINGCDSCLYGEQIAFDFNGVLKIVFPPMYCNMFVFPSVIVAPLLCQAAHYHIHKYPE